MFVSTVTEKTKFRTCLSYQVFLFCCYYFFHNMFIIFFVIVFRNNMIYIYVFIIIIVCIFFSIYLQSTCTFSLIIYIYIYIYKCYFMDFHYCPSILLIYMLYIDAYLCITNNNVCCLSKSLL